MSETDERPYHLPVMLAECLEGLALQPAGTYVDVTFGGGGHSRAIVEQLGQGGKLFGFDQDSDAEANAESFPTDRFTFVKANFRYLKRFLRLYGTSQVDGILADLGISSHQIDEPGRGFSTRFEADLDMRMDRGQGQTAADVLNTYSEADLHRILGMYGEIKNARTVAAAIVSARTNQPLQTSSELRTLLERFAPKGKPAKYLAQVYQALRIEVNEEMAALEEFLIQAAEVLKPGGRLVVMSYHSLEDRMVKNFIAKGKIHGELEKDFYGNPIRPLEAVTRKPITATPEEIERNNRARSAKLRVATKV
ncbi:MAG TPA: 16S rRNA (cytosine(1402)-N(4))-methyltransferase [Cytophagales bacterium]|nr:16S rRNA (cytosine(1402)-N(4))-methyltransferase [Cytophagales bacterium]